MLGPLEVAVDDERVALGGPKQRAALASLLLEGAASCRATSSIDALWGEQPAGVGERVAAGLRPWPARALGADRIKTRGTGYRRPRSSPASSTSSGSSTSSTRATRALAAGRPRQRQSRPERRSRALARPAARRPRAISPFARRPMPRPRGAAARRRSSCGTRRSSRSAGTRRSLPELEQLIAEHPYRERLREQQIARALPHRAARRTRSMPTATARCTLVDDLGIEPGPALQELERAMLAPRPALAPPSLRRRGRDRLPACRRPRSSAAGSRLAAVDALLRERRAARHAHRAGWNGQDAARARGCRASSQPSCGTERLRRPLAGDGDPAARLPCRSRRRSRVDEPDEDVEAAIAGICATGRCSSSSTTSSSCCRGAPRIAELLAAAPRLRVLATSRRRCGSPASTSTPCRRCRSRARGAPLRGAGRQRRRAAVRRPGAAVDPAFALTDENIEAVVADLPTARRPAARDRAGGGMDRGSSLPSRSRSASSRALDAARRTAPATCLRASRRCGRRSTGATSCSAIRAACCSPSFRSSPAASRVEAAEAVAR